MGFFDGLGRVLDSMAENAEQYRKQQEAARQKEELERRKRQKAARKRMEENPMGALLHALTAQPKFIVTDSLGNHIATGSFDEVLPVALESDKISYNITVISGGYTDHRRARYYRLAQTLAEMQASAMAAY